MRIGQYLFCSVILCGTFVFLCHSKKDGKDHETIQSSTTLLSITLLKRKQNA